MILYVAGPYRGDVEGNIAAARKVAIELWEAGHFALCPHLNTAHFEEDCSVDEETYIFRDLDMLARCDGIVLAPGWEKSEGARMEWDHAKTAGMPIWLYPEIPPPHPVEVRCPNQCAGFIRTVMMMYRVHLTKNQDYSPANILATGELGVATRLWDKIARLLNLYGFRFDIVHAQFGQPKEPKHESIDDTLMDSANYSVIGMLLREGEWGN